MQADWELSQSFTSDGQGFRVACVLPPSRDDNNTTHRLLAGTQGGMLWEFHMPSGDMVPIDFQHNHAVTALLSNQQYYLTGCKDAQIRVFDATTHELVTTLEGHDKAVTSLSWASQTLFWSGSWDGTAKLWNVQTKSLVLTLEGHENTVSVCALPSTSARDDLLYVATGSAGAAQNNVISDMSVRIWQADSRKGASKLACHVKNDHDGPIRDVCVWDQLLASCSNDGTVKLRSMETGESTATLSSLIRDPPILLSLAASTEVLAASAEDGHVFVWQHGGGEPQVIRHASCVWSVRTLENGDLVTCCQDGFLRVWTQVSDRMAPLEERQKFVADVQEAVTKQAKGPSADEVAKLPKWELSALQQGKSEGQVQVFNKDGVAIAAQWSAASGTWIEVGQVMGSSQDTGVIDGVQYDHVLPIEVDTSDGGVVKLQIGYNNGENTFVAAQRFIDAHMLPQYHLSQIADYIQQRVGHAPTTLGATDTPPAAVGAGAPMAMFEHLPAKGYLAFELAKVASLEKMQMKLKETGNLSEAQLSHLDSLLQTLGATSRYHSTKMESEGLRVITDMLKWPATDSFPAIDLARLAVLHPDAASLERSSYWSDVLQLAFQQCERVTENDGTATVAVPMLSLRLCANCFRGGPGSLEAIVTNLDSALGCAEKFVSASNKNVRLSVATLLLNISSYLHTNQSLLQGHRVVSIVDKLLGSKLYESEATARALIALGTVCLAGKESREAARTLYLTSRVEMAASPHGDKAKAVAKEVYSVLA